MKTFQLNKLDTFEKCCNYINVDPNLPDVSMITEQHATAIQNNYILMVICEAWNKADKFIPDYNNPNQRKWFPVFEYNRISGSFSFCASIYYYSNASLGSGSRLCLASEERANQFGRQFIDFHNSVLLIDTPAKNMEKAYHKLNSFDFLSNGNIETTYNILSNNGLEQLEDGDTSFCSLIALILKCKAKLTYTTPELEVLRIDINDLDILTKLSIHMPLLLGAESKIWGHIRAMKGKDTELSKILTQQESIDINHQITDMTNTIENIGFYNTVNCLYRLHSDIQLFIKDETDLAEVKKANIGLLTLTAIIATCTQFMYVYNNRSSNEK